MYCRNCGQEVGSEDKFCKNCGSSSSESSLKNSTPIISINTNGFSEKSFYSYAAIATSIVCVVLLFQKWFSVSLFGESKEFSLFSVYDWVEMLGEYVAKEWLQGVSAFIFILIALCIIAVILYGIFALKIISKSDNSKAFGRAATVVTVILFIIVGLTVLGINSTLKSEFGDYFGDIAGSILKLSSLPYITVVVALLGQFLFINKLENKSNVDGPSESASGRLEQVQCANCGSWHDFDYPACPVCKQKVENKFSQELCIEEELSRVEADCTNIIDG